jgi:hypothetical protein
MTAEKISGKGTRMKPLSLLLRTTGLLGMTSLSACFPPQTPVVSNCPRVAVLAQGSRETLFQPGRQDIAAEIAQARITGVAGTCKLDADEKVLRVVFQAGFSASSGPAYTGGSLTLPYLISLSRGDDILSVSTSNVTFAFNQPGTTQGAATQPIRLVFPDKPETAETEILVSFRLTPDQLAYNEAHPDQ